MQKWLPDAFSTEASTPAAVVHGDDLGFESEQALQSNPQDVEDGQATKKRLFMSESGFSGPQAIMNHLTPDERAQVFELVEQDISRDFTKRETELRAQLASDFDQAQKNFLDTMESFSQNLQQAMATHMKEVADMSARLALQLAEKIVRSRVEADPDILIKALETTLFKVDSSKSIIVNVNPEQVELLDNQPQLLERLGINQVVADRRVDPGGCLVRTEKMEWDATLKGQLEYLNEVVEEMIATGDQPDLTGKGVSPDEPSLD